MKKNKVVFSAALLVAMSLPWQANATTLNLNFSGSGVSGSLQLTYGAATDAKYPQAFEVTGISGVFSDVNNGLNIINAPVGPLVAITHSTPEPLNLLAPNDFSRFAVASGLDPISNGFLTYDNLFWPGGSPPTASDYPVHGGFLDIYGLMFSIGGGKVVDFWSNGDFSGTGNGPIDYGVAVADHDKAYDYVGGVAVAETGPGSIFSLGSCLLGMLAFRRSSGKN